ncbi:MAG: permease [Porticoccaceae bacterium]
MSDHCHETESSKHQKSGAGHGGSCHSDSGKPDYLLWGSLLIVVVLYLQTAFLPATIEIAGWYQVLATSVFELINTMWWGVLLGILMLALLSKVPREFVMAVLGTKSGPGGIFRATAAGVMLDLCNHGILMVGAKLYERGASIGQVMAFLIASPWNSLSLTLVMIALIGVGWTLAFILLSMMIAIIAGIIFDFLVSKKVLPGNPASFDLPKDFHFWKELKTSLKSADYSLKMFQDMLIKGVQESRMVMRWLLFGVILAGLIRAFVSPEQFGTYFGPTLAGLGLTIVAATIIEVCSEGSTPIAADLLTRANAPGNSFAFLMTGVSTDYTEIMVMRDTTKSWKIALFLPLLTVPQILVISWLINGVG